MMLKEPIDRKALTKQKIKMFSVLAILSALIFGIRSLFYPYEPPKPDRLIFVTKNERDTTEIDITGWNKAQIDSLIRSGMHKRTQEDDSLYRAYGLNKLDSMMHVPTSPLVDSILNGLR